MGKKDKIQRDPKIGKEKKKEYILTLWTKKWIKAVLLFLVATIITLAFFRKAGDAGALLMKASLFLVGNAIYLLPVLLVLAGAIFVRTRKKGGNISMALAVVVSLFGITGVLGAKNLNALQGGWVGYLAAKILAVPFGFLVANIVFTAILIIGGFIFLQFVWQDLMRKKEEDPEKLAAKMAIPGRSFDSPNLKVRGVEPARVDALKAVQKKPLFGKSFSAAQGSQKVPVEVNAGQPMQKGKYALPPIDLLAKNETAPTSGNIKENSVIIKKTFENFGIPVEMTEVNVGPAVTQYAFKPAEGVKLSKITTLSNNLALALA